MALRTLCAVGVASALSLGVTPSGLARPKVAVHSASLRLVRMEEKAAPPAEKEAPPAPPPPPPPVEYSQSLPFLVKRKALTGYVGDVGFDPVGFSEILPMVRRSRRGVRQPARLPSSAEGQAAAPEASDGTTKLTRERRPARRTGCARRS
jgi:hypothetical protein